MNDLLNQPSRRAVLVVGMHRSGTSALTRVINLHGVPLGHALADAASDNETGFWENQAFVHLHERILDHVGSSWDDPRELPEDWLEKAEAAGFVSMLVAIIREEFGGAPLWAVKDPRLCRLLPLWLKALAILEIEPRLVFAVRHPAEVVSSLVRRNQLSPAVATMLWLRYLAEPLRASGECRRCILDYAALLGGWRVRMDSLRECLDVEWPCDSDAVVAEVESHLRPELKHQHAPSLEKLLPEMWRHEMLKIYSESLAVMRRELGWDVLEASVQAFLDRLEFASPLVAQVQVKSQRDRVQAEVECLQEARDVYRAEAERLYSESAISRQEAVSAHGKTAAAQAEAAAAQAEAERLRLLALMHEKDASEQKAQLVSARGELSKRQARIVMLERVQQELEVIRASRSWRWTRPMRFALRLIRARGYISEDDRQRLRRLFGRRWRPEVASRSTAITALSPLAPVTQNGRPLLASRVAGRRDVFVWSVIDWHFRIQRPQHMARELAAAGHRVFYVSCHFLDAGQPGFAVEPLDDQGRLFQVRLNLAGAPAIYHAVPTPDAREQLRSGLGELLVWTRSSACLSLVQHPYWLEVARELPNMRLVYDCMDHHSGFEGNSPEVLAREGELMRTADLLVVTSQWLYEEAGKFNPHTLTVRNACEYKHFASPAQPCYFDEKRRKVIGYYGAIAEWFDLDLLEQVARRFHNCLVLMVGADTVGAGERLRHLANVKFVGEVPYAKLPFYLTAFDVCLLPFQVIPLTLATNPVKVYEYLSAGKEVVAIDLPEMQQFEGLVRTAIDHEAFLEQLAAALSAEPDPEVIARRRKFASEQTWAHRVQSFVCGVEALEEPLVSVIVVTYNNLELTKTCLRSLELYSNYGNLEIVVVDNASADETPAFLIEWATEGEHRRIILNQDNRGFAAANNQGLAVAGGEYLVLLNNDTHVTPGWVATLCGHLRRDNRLGMIGPVTNNIGNEARIEIQYPDMERMLEVAGDYTARHLGQLTPLRTAAFFCVMLRRQVYEKVGPLDEAFGIGFFEDDDYCRRVEKAGWSIACAEDVFIHHHLSASFNKLKQAARQKLFEKNKVLYEQKWGPWEPHKYRPAALD